MSIVRKLAKEKLKSTTNQNEISSDAPSQTADHNTLSSTGKYLSNIIIDQRVNQNKTTGPVKGWKFETLRLK